MKTHASLVEYKVLDKTLIDSDTIYALMKAVLCTKYGPPEVLQIQNIEKPQPRNDEILVKVNATTVNAGDVRMRSFTVPKAEWLAARLYLGITKPKRSILGMQLSGEVEAVGKDVERFKVGDQVFASTGLKFGAHAEYICLKEDAIMAIKPKNLSYEEAAAIPTAGIGALSLLKRANIEKGQKVLVYGASGAVGTYAVQLAKHFGASVTGVCSASNFDLVKSLGADNLIDYTVQDFAEGNQCYDVVFDSVLKLSESHGKKALRDGGLFLSITKQKGETVQDLNCLKELSEAEKLTAVIDRIYPLEEIISAHRYVEHGHKKGNVVISVSHEKGNA